MGSVSGQDLVRTATWFRAVAAVVVPTAPGHLKMTLLPLLRKNFLHRTHEEFQS